MSNKHKDGDFNLDEELRNKIVANEDGLPLSDDHEDKIIFDDDTTAVNKSVDIQEAKAKLMKKYGINPYLKSKDELINSEVLLSVRNLKQFFFFGSGVNRAKLKAVSNVSFDVYSGECFGIVGESGCGKTTTGRSIIKLYDITSGSVYYKGFRISAGNRWNKKEIKYTKIRLNQALTRFEKEKKEALAALDKNSSDYAQKVDKILLSYNQNVTAAKEHAQKIISTQQEKLDKLNLIINILLENY